MYTWEIMASFEGSFEGTSRLILRSQSDTPLLPSIGIDCEFQLLKFLKSKKFKVPKPIYLDRSGLLTGNPAFIMQKTTGSSKFIGADSKLNILDRKQLTRDIGHQLGKLHKLNTVKPIAIIQKSGRTKCNRPLVHSTGSFTVLITCNRMGIEMVRKNNLLNEAKAYAMAIFGMESFNT